MNSLRVLVAALRRLMSSAFDCRVLNVTESNEETETYKVFEDFRQGELNGTCLPDYGVRGRRNIIITVGGVGVEVHRLFGNFRLCR